MMCSGTSTTTGLVGVDHLEVDVGDGAAHGVALDLAGHDGNFLPSASSVIKRVEALLTRDGGAELFGVRPTIGSGCDALAVDDGGDRARRGAGGERCANPARGSSTRAT